MEALSSGAHADCEIYCSGSWRSIACHSVVLVNASPFLALCLENIPAGKIPVIYLPDVQMTIFEKLLKYIYTGKTFEFFQFRNQD